MKLADEVVFDGEELLGLGEAELQDLLLVDVEQKLGK